MAVVGARRDVVEEDRSDIWVEGRIGVVVVVVMARRVWW